MCRIFFLRIRIIDPNIQSRKKLIISDIMNDVLRGTSAFNNHQRLTGGLDRMYMQVLITTTLKKKIFILSNAPLKRNSLLELLSRSQTTSLNYGNE